MSVNKDDIVTINMRSPASNTFIVDKVEGETVLLTHPLAHGVLIRKHIKELNTVAANLKDSCERSIDFANLHRSAFDQNTLAELESLALYFFVNRKLTPIQKKSLANMCGIISRTHFEDNLKKAMEFITANSSILDEFNSMWYNNFLGLFSGRTYITSDKQRTAIFNIAGHVLAELGNPKIKKA
jgi:hypothetical protein